MVNVNRDREKRLREIQIYSFLLVDVNLYLDAYPDSREALAYFHKYTKLLNDAVEEYERRYGPITASGVKSDTEWTWVKEPWPWEYSL